MAVRTANGRRRPTMREVAQAAGVSVQTVSNLLNERVGEMTPQTRERVEKAMQSLGYHPNLRARSLRSNRSNALGFLLLDADRRFLADPMTDLIVAGVADVARDARYGLLIQADRPDKKQPSLFGPLLEQRVDGAILFLSGTPELRRWHIREATRIGMPFVVFEHPPNRRTASVTAANRQGACELAEHLIERGHRRIAFVAASAPWPMIEQRFAGYRDALVAAGIEPDPTIELFDGAWKASDGAKLARRLMSGPHPPTAIMAGNDLLAVGAIGGLHSLGKDVPGDCAVAGFDDFDFAAFISPALTTVRIPAYEMGMAAAEWLVAAIEGSTGAPIRREFKVELAVRDST